MNKKNTLLLIARLIVGGVFIYTGWLKVSDMATTLGYFNALHIPTFLTYIVAYVELLGGILVVLGLWADCAATALVVVMLGAIWFTYSSGFQMFGLPLVMLSALLSIIASGPGTYSAKLKKVQ